MHFSMGSNSGPYDPNLNVNQYVNPNEPEPLPFTSPPMPRSPPPVWPVPVNSDYPNFYAPPIDENDLTYMEYLNPAIFEPDSNPDESCNNNNNIDNNAENHHTSDNNNNTTQTVGCNGEKKRSNNNIIRGDDIIVGASDRNDVLEIIDLCDEDDNVGGNNNVGEDGEEMITSEMVRELLGDTGSLEEYLQIRNDHNANNGNSMEENVDGNDRGKAVVIEQEEAADVNAFSNLVVRDGMEGEAGTSAGPSGTGRIMFHRVLSGSFDCSSCNVASGLYSTNDPRFRARISVHGLNGMYHHMVFEFQNADPALAQEVEMFIFDMYGLSLEKINENLAFYNIQINQNGEIELHETFLNIYVAICGQGFLSQQDTVMSNGLCEEQTKVCDEQTVPPGWSNFDQSNGTTLCDEQTSGWNVNYQLNQGDESSGGQQPIAYILEAPVPLSMRRVSHPLLIDTAPQPLMLEAPLPNYNHHYQQQQHHHHHYNHNAMPQGVSGYLTHPNLFAEGPSSVNRSIEADPLSFLDHEIPDWMRGASSPEPEEEDDQIMTPRPTVGIQRERTANMSLLDLARYFHVKAEKASTKLKVCSTTLKIVCRKKGLKRWPYRQIRSIDNKIIGLKRMAEESTRRGDSLARLTAERDIQKQRSKRIELYRSILKKMRDGQEEDDRQEEDDKQEEDNNENQER